MIRFSGVQYEQLNQLPDYSCHDEPEDTTTILRNLMNQCELRTDDTFYRNASGVSIRYISGGGCTLQDEINYLMRRQFFGASKSDRMRILVYNHLTGTYGLYSVDKPLPRQGTAQSGKPNPRTDQIAYPVTLQFTRDTRMGQFYGQGDVGITTDSTVNAAQVAYALSPIEVTSYDMHMGTWDVTTIQSGDIVKYVLGENASSLPQNMSRLQDIALTP